MVALVYFLVIYRMPQAVVMMWDPVLMWQNARKPREAARTSGESQPQCLNCN